MRLMHLSDDDFAAHVCKRKQVLFDHWADWRREARELYDFIAGKMWSEEDREKMKDSGKVPVSYNQASAIIDAVIGLVIANPQDIRCFPRTTGAVQVNEILTAAIDRERDNTNADHEDNDAARDMLIAGIGGIEIGIDYDQNPNGDTLLARVDPLEFAWDNASTRQNFADARDIVRVRTISRDAFDTYWPQDRDAATGTGRSGITTGQTLVAKTPADDYGAVSDTGKIEDDEIEILHYQWFETTTIFRVQNVVTGGFADMNQDEFNDLCDRAAAEGIDLEHGKDYRRTTHSTAMQAFLAGGELLERGPCLCPNSFSWKFMTGKRDHMAGVWYGLGRLLKDPQMWFNKLLSEVIYILANSSNGGGLVYEDGAFVDERKAEENWSNPAQNLKIRPGFFNKWSAKPTAPFPAGLAQIMTMSGEVLRNVTGVSLEMMGLTDRDQPGVLEYQRRQAAMGTLSDMLAAVRRYRREAGQVMVHLITTYLADGRLVRLARDTGEEFVPLIKDAETIEYEVVVDQAPTAPNEKERTAAVLQQLLPMALQAGIMPPPSILRYLPLPSALTEEWIKTLEQQSADGQPSPEMAKMQAELQMKEMEAQAKQQQAQADLALRQEQAQADLALRQEQVQAEILLKQQQAQADLELRRQQIEADREMKLAEMQAQIRNERMMMRAKIGMLAEEQGLKKRTADHKMAVTEDVALARMLTEAGQKADGGDSQEKGRAASTGKLTRTLDAMTAAVAQSAKQSEKVAEILAAVQQSVTAPRTVKRDARGRIVGVTIGG